MSALHGAGVPLGAGQQVPVRKLTVWPVCGVDVFEGSPIPGTATHHVRILLPSEGEAILLPCNRHFLASVRRQIDNLLSGEGNQNGN